MSRNLIIGEARDFPENTLLMTAKKAFGGFSLPQQCAHQLASRPRHRAYSAVSRQSVKPSPREMQGVWEPQNIPAPAVSPEWTAVLWQWKTPGDTSFNGAHYSHCDVVFSCELIKLQGSFYGKGLAISTLTFILYSLIKK